MSIHADPEISETGWTTIKEIVADLSSKKFMGLVAATALLWNGSISEETFRWIFGFYIVGNVGEHFAKATVQRAALYGSRLASFHKAVRNDESGCAAESQVGHRSGLPQQGR